MLTTSGLGTDIHQTPMYQGRGGGEGGRGGGRGGGARGGRGP